MSLLTAAVPAKWLFYIFEAVDIIKEALEDIDWAEVRQGVSKLEALPGWDEAAALDAAADDIADDLDDAIDWAEKLPGLFGEVLEAKDHELWKRLVKAEAKRQAKRAARKTSTKRQRNVQRYTKRLQRRVAKEQHNVGAGSSSNARRRR